MGAILGVRERADTLARYVEALFADLEAGLAEIPADDRPRVYFARGPEGLETGLKGSINTEIIELAGGRNVADPGDAAIRRGITDVSIEQVIVANPDTIITWDRNFYQAVWNDPIWRNIPAVAAGRVWLSPTAPFGWIDRPPSVNRVIGLKWLSGLFYPERFDFNLAAETRRFYKLFYHVDLSDDELDQLLEWARGRPAN
jgi:iron complex transport system substrate-binding protein